jgi:hypothetical protein
MAASSPPGRSLQAARLDFLAGRWRQTNRFHGGPFGAEGAAGCGSVDCRWALGGVWLVSEARLEIPGQGPYEVLTAVTYDVVAGKYRAHSLNSLGRAVEYEGAWQDEATLVFDALRPRDGLRARVVYTKNPDGTVGFRAEQAGGDAPFRPCFEPVLSRSG